MLLGAVAIFFGSMIFFALYDAIRTRNDRGTRPQPAPDGDDELRRLRQMAGLENAPSTFCVLQALTSFPLMVRANGAKE